MKFEERYKKEMDVVPFSSDYEIRLVENLKNTEKKKNGNIISGHKISGLIAAVIVGTVILAVSTVAEPSPHTPDATTVQFQNSDTAWEDRWKRSKKFPYEHGNEEYAVTVLGIASGEFLNECDGFSADRNRDYFVTAVRSCRGDYLTLDNNFSVKITPLIYGRSPWEVNSDTLCEDVRVAEKNGIIYYLFDTSFIDRFAGRIICFASYEGEAPTSEIFTMKDNGIITFSENYAGFGKIFELPKDISETYPEIAEEMLSQDILSDLR